MVSLQQKYYGAQDKYFTPQDFYAITLESKYLDTKVRSIVWKKEEVSNLIPKDAIAEYKRICKAFKEEEDPFEYVEEYVNMMKKYEDQGIWDLLRNMEKPKPPSNQVDLEFEAEGRADIGFTGLYFVGNPLAVESIEFTIGGQCFDKIYPSITGQFDPIPLLNTVIPNPIYHRIRLRIRFLSENEPLQVCYDRVLLKTIVPRYEALYASTQYMGAETVKKGLVKTTLPFSHPVEFITIFSKAPLTKVTLNLDGLHSLHVPCKGIQNGHTIYEVSFNRLINFSRIDRPVLECTAEEDTIIHPFAKTYNVGQFLNGMVSISFSK